MKLFVIGNGFDLAHNLPTAYSNFRAFLKKRYGESSYLPLPQSTFMPDGEIRSDKKTDAQILLWLIDNSSDDSRWGTFEHTLGELSYSELFESDYDDDDDHEPFRQIYQNEDAIADYSLSFQNFPSLFVEWIKSIQYDPKDLFQEKYGQLFKDGLFLSFNYTDVLERVYGIGETVICHIHGRIGEKLVFGHTNEESPIEQNIMMGEGFVSIQSMHEALFKDTNKCLNQNRSFFDKMSNVDEIFFLGWGMNEEDAVYLQKIKEMIGERHIIVHFTEFEAKTSGFQNKLEKLSGLDFCLGETV